MIASSQFIRWREIWVSKQIGKVEWIWRRFESSRDRMSKFETVESGEIWLRGENWWQGWEKIRVHTLDHIFMLWRWDRLWLPLLLKVQVDDHQQFRPGQASPWRFSYFHIECIFCWIEFSKKLQYSIRFLIEFFENNLKLNIVSNWIMANIF